MSEFLPCEFSGSESPSGKRMCRLKGRRRWVSVGDCGGCPFRQEAAQMTEWDVSQPSRGLGDAIAKFTHATGIDAIVEAVAGKSCGCGVRQEKLNRAVPFT